LLLTLNDGEKMNNTNKLEQHKEFLLQKRHSILAQLPKELLEQLVQIEHSLLLLDEFNGKLPKKNKSINSPVREKISYLRQLGKTQKGIVVESIEKLGNQFFTTDLEQKLNELFPNHSLNKANIFRVLHALKTEGLIKTKKDKNSRKTIYIKV